MYTVDAQSAFKKVCITTLHYRMYDVQITYMVSILKFTSHVLCMLSSCECCCKLRGVWMSWITFILATPPAEEETRGLTKNAEKAANRQQK